LLPGIAAKSDDAGVMAQGNRAFSRLADWHGVASRPRAAVQRVPEHHIEAVP